MDKKEIRKEIAILINSIKEHSDNIGEKEHIPQLELELILSKIEKLYKKSIVFNFLNSEKDSMQTKVEAKKAEPVPMAETKTEIKADSLPPSNLFGEEVVVPEKKVEKKSEKKEIKQQPEEKEPVINIKKPAITDIRAAIGINDKFRFANELFKGNIQEYEIAVSQLNNAETLDSAMEYFMNIQQLYNWDNEHECVKSLYDIVERRYV
ncbi:MAG: hypothetical protein K0Q95_1923 [Bacteroidota bacterium]|jgi:hypothetical protein|nr:hypothetical protein [Bacteroidota bacterium]